MLVRSLGIVREAADFVLNVEVQHQQHVPTMEPGQHKPKPHFLRYGLLMYWLWLWFMVCSFQRKLGLNALLLALLLILCITFAL